MSGDNYTLKEMVTELRAELKAVRGELIEVQTLQKEQIKQQKIANGRTEKNERRIKALETRMYMALGAIALISFLGLNQLVVWAGA